MFYWFIIYRFIIYLSLCKYRYNILYMQINIPGLMKAQGQAPKAPKKPILI